MPHKAWAPEWPTSMTKYVEATAAITATTRRAMDTEPIGAGAAVAVSSGDTDCFALRSWNQSQTTIAPTTTKKPNMIDWNWSPALVWLLSAALSGTDSCNASPALAASTVATKDTPRRPRTTQLIRANVPRCSAMTITPTAQRGTSTTGMCTSSGWAGSPNRVSMVGPRVVLGWEGADGQPGQRTHRLAPIEHRRMTFAESLPSANPQFSFGGRILRGGAVRAPASPGRTTRVGPSHRVPRG